MKFEAGKSYRMRNGLKAQIDHVDCDGIYPMSGVVTNTDGGKNPCAWYANGRTKDEHYGIPLDIFDLVSPWDEPVKIYIALGEEKSELNGVGFAYWEERRTNDLIICVEVELTDEQARALGINVSLTA